MSKSKRNSVRFNGELMYLFESSWTHGIASKFKLRKQRFKVESACGVLECEGDFRLAADVLDSFFRNSFYETNESELNEVEARTHWEGDYLKDEGLQPLLARSREERAVLMPHALRLFEEQLPSVIKEAIGLLVMSVKEQTIRELQGQTSLSSVNTQQMRERLPQVATRALRARSDSPKKGRPRGSKLTKSKSERRDEQVAFEKTVVETIKALYPFDENKISSSNNRKPTKKRVAEALGISVRTLTRRTKPGVGKSFEQLVDCAEMQQRKCDKENKSN